MKSYLNAVLYARFSSEKQQESSITVQLAECKKYCAANNIRIVGTYADEARTGTDGNREQFQQMLADAVLGSFNLVVVHRWDRFARNVELALTAKSQLEKLGVKVVSTVEQHDDTPEGEFFNLMSLGMAALYSKRLARESFNGQIENAKQAKAHAGIPLYGYEVVNKKYRIVPKEAEAIRIMFEMVAAGKTYRETVDFLNAQGFRRRDGRLLSYNISDTLRQKQYTGEYIFNLYQRTHIPKEGRQRKLKTESEIVRVPNGMPAIVDEKTFIKVQEILDGRKQKRNRYSKGKYLLTGLITCGQCGYSICGIKYTAHGMPYFKYACNNKRKHAEACNISIVYFDKYIVNLFTQSFLLLKNSAKILTLMEMSIAAVHDRKVIQIKELKQQCAESNTTLKNLEDIVHKNQGKAIATIISNDLADERQKIHNIESEIDRLKSENSRLPKLNETVIRKNIQKYKQVLNGLDFYQRQAALRELIVEIKVTGDIVETTINLSALAEILYPLNCKIIGSKREISSPFLLSTMDFGFDKLDIRIDTANIKI